MYPAEMVEGTPNYSKRKRKPHICRKSKEQFEISSKMLKVPAQSATLLGRSVEPRSIQPEPQIQTYQVIKRGGKISRCNGCGEEFDQADGSLRILGRYELD